MFNYKNWMIADLGLARNPFSYIAKVETPKYSAKRSILGSKGGSKT